MSSENVLNEVRESLNGRPGQPIVFGVCQALAQRFDKEAWIFRAAAIVMLLLWTLPALAAYVVAGLVMAETENRTRRFFSGLAVIIREKVDQGAEWLQGCCTSDSRRYHNSGY